MENTALITGAARGIGLETTNTFLEAGWRVAMLDRDADTLTAAHAALASNRTAAIHADVSREPDTIRAVAETEAAFGRLDALVNNAGVAEFSRVEDTGYALWREIMATNLDGPFLMGRAATPLLARRGGAIVNVSSISGLRASTLRVAYGVSKAALAHLTKQQAVELGEKGIRVNTVAPGPVDTAMALKVHTPEIRADYHDAIPLNRYGAEREIAEAILFLCSEKAGYITGQTLAVDGGFDAAGVGLPTLRRDNA
jgi:NAD(P)-dependent dehydrogenase (short-subunit alcohol dehydrogenase family)